MPQIRALKTRGMGTIYSSDQFVGLVSKRISSLHPAEPSVILFALFVQSDMLSHCMLYVWVGQSSPLKPSCKTVLLQARTYFKKSSKSLKLYALRQRAMSMWTVDPTSLLLSLQNGEMQWCHNILLIFSYFCLCLYISCLCKSVCFEKKKNNSIGWC